MQQSSSQFKIEDISDVYIELFVRDFMDRNINAINNLCFSVYGQSSKLSILAFQEIISAELKKACYSFVNNSHDPKYIDSYLFSCIRRTIKNLNNEDKSSVYVCPACKYLNRIEILEVKGKKLSCNICRNAVVSARSQAEETLFTTFYEHGRKGYRCPDCDNFIPERGADMVRCPFPNCFFVGEAEALKSMRHPSIKVNLEIPSLNNQEVNSNRSPDTEIVVQDDFRGYLKVLNDVIDSQINLIHYKSNESTIKNKLCMYQAFKNIIDKYPEEMISYLIFLNRNVRMQHKIFQEFVKLLEDSLPFSFKKNGKMYEVKTLTDENLCIFDGLSEFTATVDEKHEIPNETQELYVGGRKGSYCRSFYIGKVLDIIDIDSKESILGKMKEYTFFKIIMADDVEPQRKVMVKHLRIPPHYQMGGMVYLNRIRRNIVDKAYYVINGKKRAIKR